ncbi:cytochrome C oxidase subunit IV family protein [Novosphingobium sp. M1R2S20]|uniref:Cytochrome C oxidase subunit IV family protein n=1 Tax=Novosphingobium rhizovicinum TaxID=3228928 RepID=A0ABV3RG55_9SPHN
MSANVKRLVAAGLMLQILLGLTLLVAFLPLGSLKPWIGYGIASAKAALVLWFFMEMREEGGLVRLATVAAFAWLAIMLTLGAADYLSRGWVAAYLNP